MSLLKKENALICSVLMIMSMGIFSIPLASLMDLYDKDAWYSNPKYWLIGFLCLIFPIFIMIIIFSIQMICKVAASLEVPGKEIYNFPYTWILCLIVPIVGWVMFIVMYIYLIIWISYMLYQGKGEKYIK